jgi:hypothetical protein
MTKFIRKCPLCFAIIVTFILLNVAGEIAIYNDMITPDISVTHPLIASVFEYASDMYSESENAVYDETPIDAVRTFAINVTMPTAGSESESADSLEAAEPNEQGADGEDSAVVQESTGGSDSVNDYLQEHIIEKSDEATGSADYGKVVYTDRKTGDVRSPYNDEEDVKASSTVYNYATVDCDFFANSLFIGDSRVDGLQRFSKLSTATYCFKDGLTVWSLHESGLVDKNYAATTIEETLGEKNYDYIYIMLGINEAGRGTAVSFANQFKEDILYIRQVQPTAKIVIVGITGVTRAYSNSNADRSTDNLTTRNVFLSYLANGVDVFYLDLNDSVCDEDGVMAADYSYDGVHLKAQYYDLWADYICSHAFVN